MNMQRAIEAKKKTEEVRLLEESAKRRREEDVNDSSMVSYVVFLLDVLYSYPTRLKCVHACDAQIFQLLIIDRRNVRIFG